MSGTGHNYRRPKALRLRAGDLLLLAATTAQTLLDPARARPGAGLPLGADLHWTRSKTHTITAVVAHVQMNKPAALGPGQMRPVGCGANLVLQSFLHRDLLPADGDRSPGRVRH